MHGKGNDKCLIRLSIVIQIKLVRIMKTGNIREISHI